MDSGRVYRVGRDQTNDIVIEHGSVSRHHCELRLDDDGTVLITDLNSMNGTAVRQNGAWEHIDKATVERDERILLGEIVTTVAALLMRAPKPAERLRHERLIAAAPAPVQIPRKIPMPTMPAKPAAKPESSGLVSRLIKSDWARLHRRSRNPKPQRDEPSICLPAFVSAAEIAAAEGDPARLLRSPPSLRAPRAEKGEAAPAPSLPTPPADVAFKAAAEMAPTPVPAPGTDAPNVAASTAASAAEGAAIVPPPPADGIELPQSVARRTPSLLAAPSRRADAQESDSAIASSPPSLAPQARRRLLPRWLPRPSSPEFAKWAVVGSALLLMSGGAVAYLRYGQDAEPQVAAAAAAPAAPAETGKADRAPGEPARAKPAAKPSGERKTESAKPAAPKADEASAAPTRAGRPWQRSIEGTPDSSVAAAAASGDGICLAGATSLSGSHEAWVVRTDIEGNVRWQRRPGGPKRDGALAVAASGDGGCVAAGYDSDETRLWIFKLDSKGVLAWSKQVPAGHTGRAVAIVRTRDGGYAVAAHAKAAPNKPHRAFVLRLSARGEIGWSKYAGKGESRAADLRETQDGGFVVAGVGREKDDPRLALWAARLDRKGHAQWEAHYPATGTPEAVRLASARGREYVIAASMSAGAAAPGAATTGAGVRLLRIAHDGDVVWDRRHAGSARRVAALVLVRGGILVAGDTGDETPGLWLAQYDAQGRAVRESSLPALKGDRAAALTELDKGRLVFAGTAALDSAAQRGVGLIFIDRDRQLAAH